MVRGVVSVKSTSSHTAWKHGIVRGVVNVKSTTSHTAWKREKV